VAQNRIVAGEHHREGHIILELRKLAFLGIAPFALGAALLGACGGDDDDGGGGGGSDEDYVRAICGATNDFQDDLVAAFADIDPDASEEEGLEALAEPFEEFANAIEDANPPSDLSDWHDGVVDAINGMVEQIKDGDASVLEEDDPLGEPPADVSERLEAVAADIPECAGSVFESD
jgi:hypothetical protein